MMIRKLIAILVLASLSASPSSGGTVTFDWARVGNVGNAADPETGYGAVDYAYRIAKHVVTNAQYAEFLNAVAASDNFGGYDPSLYNRRMGSNSHGGIGRRGTPGSYKYTTKPNMAHKPVNFVSFLDAMRFTNWLHNGQGNGGTESGVYAMSDSLSSVRSLGARFWVPNENEWYKAAYHDASAGTAGVYFDYATGTNSTPISDKPGDNPAAVNYFNDDHIANGFNDGFVVSGEAIIIDVNASTDVGDYQAAVSPYGTFDQNGNVSEWNETLVRYPSRNYRGLRGGSWVDSYYRLLASNRPVAFLTDESSHIGFRVATVPEPSAMMFAVLFIGGLLVLKRRSTFGSSAIWRCPLSCE